jgi:hypothetical protein
MDATYNFGLGFAQGLESRVETIDRSLRRYTLQRIATRISLISPALGFFALGTLIIVNRHHAEPNGLSELNPTD